MLDEWLIPPFKGKNGFPIVLEIRRALSKSFSKKLSFAMALMGRWR